MSRLGVWGCAALLLRNSSLRLNLSFIELLTVTFETVSDDAPTGTTFVIYCGVATFTLTVIVEMVIIEFTKRTVVPISIHRYQSQQDEE
ncbi:hypothetical protein HOT81_gp131 [Gordonia phage Fryberger]|uniref:Uncharacterized protein n=1 Tax=Gordonia phage Fryberger TaxID=2250392 RepID=A0A346FCT8_9CAUD|nr:hypothetical protein HOT81_gp131 [Gordonia phage Fryberger]AXN53552.1 hypothetical protein SEA_FRYBERGER_139 [Gordonia phage Fryberger]